MKKIYIVLMVHKYEDEETEVRIYGAFENKEEAEKTRQKYKYEPLFIKEVEKNKEIFVTF
jgi:hypothetical protein